MSEANNWVDALKIDPDKLSGWSEQVPEGTPLLVWCLQNGHLPVDEYLSWAVEQYQLPRLGSEFFHSAFDRSVLPSDRVTSVWTPWCFPVASWEGTTYVACVEPPRELPTGNFVFVLADPSAMHATWSEGLTGTGTGKGKTPAPKAEAPEMPDGLKNAEVKPFRLNLGTNTGINIAALMPNSTGATEAIEVAPVTPQTEVLSVAAENEAPMGLDLPPTPKVKTSAFSKPVLAATPPPPSDEAEETKEVDLVFLQLKEHYSSSMILKVDGENLSLYRWSPEQDLSALKDQVLAELTAPSFLRIVYKTQMPYHGYVVDSELHKAFFAKLGQAALPACVTAVPLKTEAGVWGILLALGSESSERAKPLQAVENAAEKLKASLGTVWQKAA